MFTADHKGAAASSLVYEKYEDIYGEVFNDDAIHVKAYTNISLAVARAPNTVVMEGKMEVAGEMTANRTYKTATETGKKIGRTLLKGIWKNEMVGLCLTDFNISNVHVSTSGKVKLKGVKRIKLSVVQLGKNYAAARLIMEELFKLDKEIPADIQRLIGLMQNRFDMRSMYHLHASLVPIAHSTLLYKTIYKQLMISKMPQSRKEQILLGLPYLTVWKKEIRDNWLLRNTYNHNKHKYNGGLGRYEHPPLPPQASAKEKRDRLLLEAQDFLDYLRNRGAHRMDFLLISPSLRYTAAGSDRASHVRFPEVICYLQENLSDQVVEMNTKEVV